MTLSSAQFDALAKLIRMQPDSTSRLAARLVFVECLSIGDAARECSTTYNAAHQAVGRIEQAYELACIAVLGIGEADLGAQL